MDVRNHNSNCNWNVEKNNEITQNNEITTNYNDLLKNTTLTGSLFPKDFHQMILKMKPMGELQL